MLLHPKYGPQLPWTLLTSCSRVAVTVPSEIYTQDTSQGGHCSGELDRGQFLLDSSPQMPSRWSTMTDLSIEEHREGEDVLDKGFIGSKTKKFYV